MKTLFVAMLGLSALLAAPATARAETTIVTVVTTGQRVPPGVDEVVRAAIVARVAALAVPPAVVHVTIEDDGAWLEVDGKRRRVPVADWTDEASARFVVVHVVDLGAPSSPVAALAPEAAPERAPAVITIVQPAPPPAHPIALEAFVAPQLAHGVGEGDPFAPGLELGAMVYRGRLALGASIGWTHGLEQAPGLPTEARYDAWPLRLSVGYRRGGAELLASGLVAAYRVAGVSRATGAQAGGGVALRYHGALAGGVGWFASAGADAFVHRVEVSVAGRVVYATPRIAPVVALGLTWRLP